jgi:hypothetical protein
VSDTVNDDWDPRESSVQEDQQRAYDDIRERCPVAHSKFMGWSLFRHQDVGPSGPELLVSDGVHG